MAAYRASLVRVIDGDTQVYRVVLDEAHAFLDQQHRHHDERPDQRVRLLGAWCPEKAKPGGREATAYATDWLAIHDHPDAADDLPLVVESVNTYTLGRLLGIVRCAKDRACLNEDLIAAGHATPVKETVHVDALRLLARETGAASPAGRLLLGATA